MSKNENQEKVIKPPSMPDALIPIIALVILLAGALYLYGSDGTAGPIQVALMLSMMVAGLVGLNNGQIWTKPPWKVSPKRWLQFLSCSELAL